jgi:ubiquinone/menaquinone biosynthesis C-methylase UbiE
MSFGKRTDDQIREHYELETRLADKLRNANWEERKNLYRSVYDEFFSNLPHLPQLNKSEEDIRSKIRFEMVHVKPFLTKEISYLELGAGDCELAKEVSKFVSKVYIAEVSNEMTDKSEYPENFEFIKTDGRNIEIPDSNIDVVYSHHLMEHIHPEDALEQLKSILRALKPGGVYICITPNRLNGPHDISKYFDQEAKGFHLKEYTISELTELFKNAGFSKVKAYMKFKNLRIFWPEYLVKFFERLLSHFSYKFRKKITKNVIIGTMLLVNVVGQK